MNKRIIITFFLAINFVLTINDQGTLIPYILTLQAPFLLFFLLKKKKIKLVFPKISMVFFLYFFANFISSVQKPTSFNAILTSFSCWLIFILSYNLNCSQNLKNKELDFFIKFSFLLTLPYLWFRFKPTLQNFSALAMTRPITGHVHVSSLLLLSLTASFLTKRNLAATWFFICLVLTNSVSSFSSLVILGPVLIANPFKFKFLESKKIRKKNAYFWSGGLTVLIIFLLSSYFHPKLLNKLDPMWLQKELFGGRQHYWTQAVKGFLVKPLAGWGLDTFGIISTRFSKYSYSLYAHGFYLQWLAEMGMIGTVLLLISIKKILLNLNLKNKQNQVFFLIILISAIESTFDYGWQFPSILFLLAFFLGNIIKTKNYRQVSYNKFIFLPLALVILATCQILSIYFYRQKNYRLSLLFYPFKKEVYIENANKFPNKLINFLFKNDPDFWAEIYKKRPTTKITLKQISLNPYNPNLYLQIPAQEKGLRRKYFKKYYQLTKNLNFEKIQKQKKENMSVLFTEAAILSFNNHNDQNALLYVKQIFKTWPWEEQQWQKIEINIKDQPEVQDKFHQLTELEFKKLRSQNK